jgi:carboxypeptidase C (cathepsin A)
MTVMAFLIGRSGVLALALVLAILVTAPLKAAAEGLPAYDAKASMLSIGADPERPDAEIFHVAYTLKGADPATRPVTFVFNGGPGAASIYLHLSAIGPKTIVTAGDGSFPAVPARLEDNPDSWIGFTDLVFIDPVGTGYSRMLPGPDGALRDAAPYFNVEGDLDSLGIFMRQWLTVNNRWSSPKAIAGESYGGQRVAALSRILAEKYSINLNRAILISPALNVELTQTNYAIVWPMSLIPTQSAIAAFHGLNDIGTDPSALKAVEEFALTEYVSGLARLGRMDAKAQEEFYAKVARLIGIDPALVARQRGRIYESMFAANLLRARGQVIDTYDGTQVSDNPTPQIEELGVFDRSLTMLGGVLLAPFMDYVRKDLGFVTGRPYIPLSLEINMRWNRASKLGGPDDLAIALAQNQDLKALVVHGYHDLNANYFMSRFALEQSTLAQSARQRLFFGTYPGGHMFYLRTKSRSEFTADVRGFFVGTP